MGFGEDAFLALAKTGYFPLCDEAKYTSSRGIGDTLEQYNPGYRFLFQKYKSHLSLYHRIPTNMVLDQMEILCEQFWGEYVETTDNKEFLRIRHGFFKGLFGNGQLYLTYEDFRNFLDTADIDSNMKKEVERIKKDYIIPKGKSLQMGYKGSKDTTDQGRFVHIETGLEVVRPKGQEEMVECTGNGYKEQNRFMAWFNLCTQMLISKENIRLMEFLCTKRMKVHFMNEVDRGIMELNNSIYNGHPFFFDKSGNFAILSTNEIMEGGDFKEFQEAIYITGDREMADLGRVGNINAKAERMTTGENYKDLMPLANRQRLVLDALKMVAMDAKEVFGIDLEFAINGIPEKLPIEGDSEQPREDESQALTGASESKSAAQAKYGQSK